MFEFYKSAPVTFILMIAGLFVAGVVTVVAIVIKGGWKDRGFMVRNGKKLLLLKAELPWTIYVEATVPLVYSDALNTVVTQIKDKVGDIFDRVVRLNPDEVVTDIKVLVALDTKLDSAGSTKHQFNKQTGTILSAFISVVPGMIYGHALKVLAHEVGHVMGLDHDEHVSSVMYPVVSERPQTYTSKDIERLKKAYG